MVPARQIITKPLAPFLGTTTNERVWGLDVKKYAPSIFSLIFEKVMTFRGANKVVYNYRFISFRYLFTAVNKYSPDVIYMRVSKKNTDIPVKIIGAMFGIKVVFFSQNILDLRKKHSPSTVYINYLPVSKSNSFPVNYIPHTILTGPKYPTAFIDYSPGDPLRIISVGKPVERKGGFILLEAIYRIKKKQPVFADIYCGYAGSLAEEFFIRLNKKISELNLHDEVKLMPFVKPEEMHGEYTKHNLFIHPGWVKKNVDDYDAVYSRMNGCSGTRLYSLLEAMRAGLPVITSNDVRLVGAIDYRQNGLVFEKANADDLADKIIQISKMDLNEMGGKSRKLIDIFYNAENFPEKFENFVNNIK
jgi:glycosyltransferase involved in cell wall biosynthesis